MKKGEYKNYRTCIVCGNIFPLTREYFKRLVTQGKEAFHNTCKKCEDERKRNIEWNNDKLLCHCCKEYKDINEFPLNGGANPIRNNRKSVCRSCNTKNQKERNKNLQNENKLLKCLQWRLLSARDRAKNKKFDFSLTIDNLVELWNKQNGKCALSNIDMTFELQNGRTPTNLSIDRIDSNKGYTIDNIQLVCMAVNQMKSDLTNEQLYMFCENILKNRHK